jgi:hypothetical protein
MSIPYYSTGQPVFNTPRVNQDSYIEFPFQDLGDTDTKIYHLTCSMRKDAYHKESIYSIVLSGLSDGNGTYILVPDSTVDNRPYWDVTIGGNLHRIYSSGGLWHISDLTDFTPFAYQTNTTARYQFPWDVPSWTVAVGTGTPVLTTTKLIPDLDSTLTSNNALVQGLPANFQDSSAYFIGDYNHSVDGDMITFDRQYANIPSSSTINSGTEIYSFPGLPSVAGSALNISINSISVSNNQTTLTLASAHGMSVGEYAFIAYKATRTIGYVTYTSYYYSYAKAITGTTGSTFVVKGGIEGQTLVSTGTFRPNATRGRSQVSRTSPTEIVRDYFLPNVSAGITEPQDITLSQPFVAYRYSEGNEVKTLSTTTTPTASEYRDIVATDGYLTRSTDVKKWKGNILVRETKQIRAI